MEFQFVFKPAGAVLLGLNLAFGLRLAGADDPALQLANFVTEGPRGSSAYSDLSGLTGGGLAVPRVVTRIDGAQLENFHGESLEDLASLVPGAGAAQSYGLTGVPVLRGDVGDAFQNGQRRAFNRNMFSPSFNAIEAVELMAGAPPAFMGYVNGTGGLVNFVTKQPGFGAPRTVLKLAYGDWDTWRGQVDMTGSVSDRLAYRVSLERLAAGSFYRLGGEDSWDSFLALAWKPRAGMRWDFSLEVYDTRYVENPGTNRPTQALIDHGQYVTGSSVSTQGAGAGNYFGNTFTPAGTVTLDGSPVLIAPGDAAWARFQTAQLIGTFEPGAGWRIVSRTYWESGEAEKHSAYVFYSGLPRSRTAEQRWEVNRSMTLMGLTHTLLGGVAARGEERISYVDFLNEAINAFDLTQDPATLRLPAGLSRFVQPVPGRPGYFAVPGGRYGPAGGPLSVSVSQTLHSRLFDGGVFLQDEMELGHGFALLAGLRGDTVAVDSTDPLPLPGFKPAHDSLTKWLPGATGSLLWRPHSKLTAYFTFNRAAAVESSSSAGGFGLTGNHLPDVMFENRSRLVEGGLKGVGPKELNWTLALFCQQRLRTNARFQLPDEIKVRGFEATFSQRPATWLTLSANGSYMDAHYVNGPLPGSIATVPQFDPAAPSDSFGSFPAGSYRLPGLSRWQVNVQAVAHLGRGWGLSGWGGVQGPQNLDLFGLVRLPRQQTWAAGLFWRNVRWEVRAECLNATNEFNWRATSTPFAGADLVTRELPRHWRATVRRTF